ncbi:MAG: hypothetical protein M0018_08825 [Nitrospiraceae bacterium]|nr:hypothetical protein [Nitrospiraceae bacterium]
MEIKMNSFHSNSRCFSDNLFKEIVIKKAFLPAYPAIWTGYALEIAMIGWLQLQARRNAGIVKIIIIAQSGKKEGKFLAKYLYIISGSDKFYFIEPVFEPTV